MPRAAAFALALLGLVPCACATENTDVIVSVYSALSFESDSAVRAVCLEVTSRGAPTQRVLATPPAGVPPRRLFDFRIVPRDENLSNPVTITVTARTSPTCSGGLQVARATRVVRFVPGERVNESVVLGAEATPTADGGVDVPMRADVPLRPDAPDTCGCPAGLACCGGRCVDSRYDPRNCGGCGQACHESAFCINGACGCPTGQQFCSSRCTDVQSDPDNCSNCNLRCSAPANGTRGCQGGECVYTCMDGFVPSAGGCIRCGMAADPACNSRTPCAAGLTNCSGFCRNLNSDRNHCASCGTQCPPTLECRGGSCRS